MKRLFQHFLPVAVSAALLSLSARSADASIIERVVAVVGEHPILLSDLRKRAHPFLIHIYATTQNPTQQAAQQTGVAWASGGSNPGVAGPMGALTGGGSSGASSGGSGFGG